MKEEKNIKQKKISPILGQALIITSLTSTCLFLLTVSLTVSSPLLVPFIPFIGNLTFYAGSVALTSIGLIAGLNQLKFMDFFQNLGQVFTNLPNLKAPDSPEDTMQKGKTQVEKELHETETHISDQKNMDYTPEENKLSQELKDAILKNNSIRKSEKSVIGGFKQFEGSIKDFFQNLDSGLRSIQTIRKIIDKTCKELDIKIGEGTLAILANSISKETAKNNEQKGELLHPMDHQAGSKEKGTGRIGTDISASRGKNNGETIVKDVEEVGAKDSQRPLPTTSGTGPGGAPNRKV